MVDGSNLATEGRTSPSLEQLDEAVRAYAAEDPGSSIIVVVDATFEHRVSDAEREEVREAMLNGELVSPPAGAIGRGDAFVLRIAERTGAIVLSNDSFQEFHGEHPWLFDEGRLIGGKPVPGRGVDLHAAAAHPWTQEPGRHGGGQGEEGPRVGAGQGGRAGPGGQEGGQEGGQGQEGATKAAPPVDTSWPITPATPPPGRAKVDPVFSSAIDEAVEEAARTRRSPRSAGLGQEAGGGQEGGAAEERQGQEGRPRAGQGRRRQGPAGPRRWRRPGRSGRRRRRSRPRPPPAVNEPLAFINFVAAFTVGSTVEGEVVSFTSHGAMVDVPLPGGGALHCYIPLTAMGTPPPTKARQVLKKGEVRPFVLAGLDPPRRVAELALPAAVAPEPRSAAPPRRPPRRPRRPRRAKKAAAKKAGRPRRRRPRRPAPAKKAAAKKAAPPAKKAQPRRRPAGQEGRPRRRQGADQEGGQGQQAPGQEGRQGRAAMTLGRAR